MPDDNYEKLLRRIDGETAPAAPKSTRAPLLILCGLCLVFILTPLAMKVLFDPASALMGIATGTSPFALTGGE